MPEYNKAAYHSDLRYPILKKVYNLDLNSTDHPTGYAIPLGYGYIPYFKVFAEFVNGQLSPFWGSDANYIFSSNYETADIYGGQVYTLGDFLYIEPYWGAGMTSCKVHARIYEGDYRNGF